MDILKILVSKIKSDLNIKNKDGYAPLHIALRANEEDVVHYLLDRGANAELETNT